MVPSSIFMMILVIYTGFTIPVRDMHPWFKWLNYLNPIGVSFTPCFNLFDSAKQEIVCVRVSHDQRVQ
jgi:ABC-type multidrug transport system permease subunit